MIEDNRKIMQDFLAPELRAISARLDSLEKRPDGLDKRLDKIDARFDDLDRRAERRHDEMMSAVAQMIEITMLRERVARLESGNYTKLTPEGFAHMTELGRYLNTGTGLEPNLLDLVRLLASELNGCEYCIGLHRHELKKLNEPSGRIDGVAAWRESDAYTQRERAALAWTEAVTNIQQGHAPDAVYDEVRAH